MSIILRARCHLLHSSTKVVRSQFDVEPSGELFGEYVLMNLVHDRGLLHDGKIYRITIEPFFPQKA